MSHPAIMIYALRKAGAWHQWGTLNRYGEFARAQFWRVKADAEEAAKREGAEVVSFRIERPIGPATLNHLRAETQKHQAVEALVEERVRVAHVKAETADRALRNMDRELARARARIAELESR